MADIHYSHALGHGGYSAQGGYHSTDQAPDGPTANSLKYMTNIAGALVSLALIAGVSVWGYKLVMRDVSGIPVVRAAMGEMRVRPQEPGGQLAQNIGLAVNQVAGAGEAAGPVDRLVLAPRAAELTDEDRPMVAKMVAPVQQPAPLNVAASLDVDGPGAEPTTGVDVATALQGGSVEDLVNQLTAGIAPIEAEPLTPATQPVVATVAAPKPEVAAIIKGPGPAQSRRPQIRPASAPAVVIPASAPAPEVTKDLDANVLPAGTRLVQLGAYASDEIARSEWDKMIARYGEYLNGKDRIVQKAQSGGRTFYRLRAHGFSDLSDARRFCSVLVAEGADCIPVVTR